MGKHFTLTIAATSFTHARDTAKIAAETELDGPYVLRTPLPVRKHLGLWVRAPAKSL